MWDRIALRSRRQSGAGGRGNVLRGQLTHHPCCQPGNFRRNSAASRSTVLGDGEHRGVVRIGRVQRRGDEVARGRRALPAGHQLLPPADEQRLDFLVGRRDAQRGLRTRGLFISSIGHCTTGRSKRGSRPGAAAPGTRRTSSTPATAPAGRPSRRGRAQTRPAHRPRARRFPVGRPGPGGSDPRVCSTVDTRRGRRPARALSSVRCGSSRSARPPRRPDFPAWARQYFNARDGVRWVYGQPLSVAPNGVWGHRFHLVLQPDFVMSLVGCLQTGAATS